VLHIINISLSWGLLSEKNRELAHIEEKIDGELT
jgi:hypothetical protein